jgi:hypothetical protein
VTDVDDPGAVPPGAAAAVFAWADAVLSDDFASMWELTDPLLRLCLVQTWLSHGLGGRLDDQVRDALAADLAQLECVHPLRPAFQSDVLFGARRDHLPAWPAERWGVASRRRPVSEDLEVIVLVDTDSVPPGTVFSEEVALAPGTFELYLLRASAGGWKVAGFDYEPPPPGRPPNRGSPRTSVDQHGGEEPVVAERIGLGDDATQRRAVDLYRQLVAVYTLERDDPDLVGQVTGDVLAEIREDPQLCAAFLYLVGVGFDALVSRISEGTGIPKVTLVSDPFLRFEEG